MPGESHQMSREQPPAAASHDTPLPEDRVGRNIGVGCFTFFIGGVSGAMVGVGIGKLVGFFTRCTPLPGLPACEWWVFAGYGARHRRAFAAGSGAVAIAPCRSRGRPDSFRGAVGSFFRSRMNEWHV